MSYQSTVWYNYPEEEIRDCEEKDTSSLSMVFMQDIQGESPHVFATHTCCSDQLLT